MKHEGVTEGLSIARDLALSPDVCIVGSGAGGSVLAARLAAAGKSVVVLEEGGYYLGEDFTLHEREAFDRLYQGRGMSGQSHLTLWHDRKLAACDCPLSAASFQRSAKQSGQ